MTLLLTTIEFILVWIFVSTLNDHYGSASFWPSGFYSFNRDSPPPPPPSLAPSSTSSSSPSRPPTPLDPLAKLTGYKSVLDQATWVSTSSGSLGPSYAPPPPLPPTQVQPASYSPSVRYNPPPQPPTSQTTYLSNSGNSYPTNEWRPYNQYPPRNDQNQPGETMIYPPFSGDLAIDCKYASVIRPIYSGSSSSGSTISLPIPLLPPSQPPSPPSLSSSYNSSPYSPPYSSSSSVSPSVYQQQSSSYPYGSNRYPTNPCFSLIPSTSLVHSEYSTYPGSSYLSSASNSAPLWSAPPPPSLSSSVSSPLYSVMDSRPSNSMMEDPERKSYHHSSSTDHSSSNQVLKSTRAVAELSGPSGVTGTVVFKQIGNKPVSIEGKIMGLASGPHGMHIYEMPFIGGDCVSSGDHYNPQKTEHGGKHDWNRHIGDLGNIFADSDGVANFEFTDLRISLSGGYSIINRTLGISEKADDLGRGTDVQSKKDGNAGSPIACGIVHLSPI